MSPEIKVTYERVDVLVPYAMNAKPHSDKQVGQIARSISTFGFVNPVLVAGDNTIIAGHGRVLAAKKLGLVVIPTVRLSHLTDSQRKAYIIADNRLTETGGGWDLNKLREELATIDFDGLGDFQLQDLELDQLGILEPDEKQSDGDDDNDEVFAGGRPLLTPPFQWFGGKSKAAPLIWSRLGADCGNYVEPFFGSGAVWFGRPAAFKGWATVNDLDGNLANVWRSMQRNPEAVAEAACWPVNECDLHARHLRLVTNRPRLAERLMADPDYCEPVIAGWWIWGACSWIGGGWCDGSGPWSAQPDDEGVPTLTRDGGNGVNRKLPHLGNGGNGVNRQLQDDRLAWLNEWFAALSASLEGVRVACGDWQRICSPGTMTRNGTCAVVLDPPYSQTEAVYAHDSSTVAHDVRKWALANGDNRDLRIALCGHDGEHNALKAAGWSVAKWAKGGGYQGADDRERIWFSPHCLAPTT